jgi:phage terminase small subunit
MNATKFLVHHHDKLPQPEADLSRSSKTYFRQIVEMSKLEAHHIKTLGLACRVLDRANACNENIREKGAYYTDADGIVHRNPAVVDEQKAMITFARLMRELNLDYVPEPPRAPMLGVTNITRRK